MKKRKLSFKKVIKFVIILLLIVIVCYGAYKLFIGNSNDKKVISVEDKIKGYGYNMDDNETAYYKELFKKLKVTLEAKKIDENKYASLVSQLFLADFFNLDNKINKNDVGGVTFIYKDFRSDFEKLAKEGIYNAVVNKENGAKSMELPIVTNVSVVDLEHITYDYLQTTDLKAIKIDLNISYKKDLDYQKTTSLVLVHNGKKLEIVSMSE
ncbi:MAG: hypothetical protein RR703_00430 [Bacilli bacterium]